MEKMNGTVSHFQLLQPLGGGGMGQVHTALDTKLKRTVVLKFVSGDQVRDPSARRRLFQEARAAAALNHANICTIYEIGEVQAHEELKSDTGGRIPSGTPFIAMEMIEGRSLEAVLSDTGPPSLDEFLHIAIQIAEGLEAAHQCGLVHRDLKPSNLQLTPEGMVKILDFGLARDDRRQSGGSEDLADMATESLALTRTGMILGTPGYMSPEQIRGGQVDWRSDIWSVGCVFYELLTGTRAFPGETVADRLASILNHEPDWSLLPKWLPLSIRQLLRRALTKEVNNRLQAIGDARIILQECLAGSTEDFVEAATPTRVWRRIAPWTATLLAATAIWILKPQPTPVPVPALRVEVPLPAGERLDAFHRRGVALSRDGQTLAFVSGPSPSRWEWPDSSRIYLRRLDQWQARAIPGTGNGLQPFFSPDGQWLGFVREGQLRKVHLYSYESATVCECDASFGASWGPDGTIVFAGDVGGLQQVSSSGGEPIALTELDRQAGEVSHRLPQFLANGRAVLFTVLRHKQVSLDWGKAQVFIQSLETGDRKLLIEGGADALYLPSGHLVFAREDQLMAIRFDLKSWETVGSEVVALEHVHRSINTGFSDRETGVAQFSVSDSGVLAYASGTTFSELKRVVVWVDRQGREEALQAESKDYLSARVSPDGLKILLTVSYPPRDVWIFDSGRQTMRRQTFEANQSFAIWGPGPDQFTFSSDREGLDALYVKTVNSGPGQVGKLPLPMMGYLRAGSWSPDGKTLAFVGTGEGSSFDILTFTPGGPVTPFLHTPFDEAFPEFSPDGHWLLYTSNESGSEEVFACPYPGPGRSIQISRGGGTSPAWSRDGGEVFYRSFPDLQHFYSVGIEREERLLTAGEPVKLFSGGYSNSVPIRRHDVGPDGRLLLIRHDREAPPLNRDEAFPAHIQVVQGWFRELQGKWPASPSR